ncbi:kinase domain protein (macronuclear) [Tetrahymena thermophila SB210]|uniref:mitogen-activated protein kinase kinase n=1 Tax=Tetrahymena thermophila (strain SB210) TaxID=312017 RepID=A4VE33_TETTS|nr:kinase domain protein [Tetrahymena thermophila SB210]EDK31792.2 kinase domain protein [Tetrahymena thermophila SB210]|eukprot:XP_001471316.2 kinase domain protein [Tetrahymena thermophila SB210]
MKQEDYKTGNGQRNFRNIIKQDCNSLFNRQQDQLKVQQEIQNQLEEQIVNNESETLLKSQQCKKKDQIIYLKLSYDSQNYWWNEQNTNTNSKNEQSSVISKGGENYMMEFQEIQKYDQNQQNKKLNYQNSLFYYQSVNESSSMADEQNDKTIKIKQFKANEKLNKSEQIKQYQYSSTKIQEKSTKLVYQDKRIQENDYQNNKIHTNLLLELKRQLKNMNYQVKENKEEIGDGFALRATKYIRQEKIQNYLVLTKFIKIENSNKKIIKKLEFLQLLQETTKYVKIEDSFQISSNNHPQQIIFVIILLEFKNTYNFLLKIEKIIDFFKENKYYLGKYIAEGGYGVIFDGKIYQNNKIQEIIFKIQFADEQNINQSEEEYNIMKGFEKNIYLINAIDYKKIDENVSVILKEKCECDLNSKLKQLQQNNQFSFTQLLQIIFDLIDGLILLRAYKIIHLDIKPSNILINHYGIHVFSDFGTSYKNKNDQSIQVKGFTPYYAPQEVLKGENNINYQSDAFSIGKTLEIVFNHYEMLNKFNKNEKNMIEKFKQILKDYALREQVSERKTCLELHKAFYEAVIFEGYLEFSESYIDKIRLILSQSCGDRNKDIYFFREVCIYYNEKILDLKQKIKKSHILSFVEIESLSESSLRKIDKISSQQDPECILIYNLIASLYNEQSQYDIEKKYLQKSLELCNELFKKGNLYTARTLNKLAFFHKKEVGLEYSLKSIQMVEDIIKGDNDFKAIYLNTLSWCYSSLNDHKQALKVQEETLKMRLSMFKLYHPRIALALINLGTKQFLYKENHPCIAQSLDYIGQCYLKMGNLEQAKKKRDLIKNKNSNYQRLKGAQKELLRQGQMQQENFQTGNSQRNIEDIRKQDYNSQFNRQQDQLQIQQGIENQLDIKSQSLSHFDKYEINKKNNNNQNMIDNNDSETMPKSQLCKKKGNSIHLKLSYDSQKYWQNQQTSQNNSKDEQTSIIYESGENEFFCYQGINEYSSMVNEQNDKTIKIKQFKANQKQSKFEQIKNYEQLSTNIQAKSTNLVYLDKKIQGNEDQNNKIHTNLILEIKRQLTNRDYQVKENKEEIGGGFVLRASKYIRYNLKKKYLVLTSLIKIQNSSQKIIKKLEFLQLLQETTKYIQIEDSFELSLISYPQSIIFVIVLLKFKNTYNFLLKIEKIIDFFKENKYYLGKYIAEGGYGVVFDGKIFQNNKIQEVIFKIQFTDKQNINASEEEYNIMKGFEKNINLIDTIDYKMIDQNVSIILMEKCECNLKDKMQQLQEKNQFSFTQLLKIIFDLIDGLILLKAYKIIHLDIKPQNILINHYGIYVISDFGTSIKNKNNQAIQVKGYTPNYAPEEVIQNNGINYQSDVYSFGKTLEIVFKEYEKLQNYNQKEKIILEKFKQIIYDSVLKNQSSERKTCLKLHKAFYEVVKFEENIEFSQSYIDKIRLILSQTYHDSNKDIQFFQEVSIYYYEKILDLKQKIKKSHILSFVDEIESLPISSLNKIDKLSSQEDPECIVIYNEIANFYNEQSQFQIAKQQLQKSLELCQQLFKKGHLYTASTLNKLGLFYLKEDGLKYSLQSLQIIEDIFKGDTFIKAIYLNTLSWCYSSLQESLQALKLQEESLKIRSNIFKLYHTRIAVALNNLGTMYQNYDLNKCLKYQLLSLKIRQSLFKENHPCTARSLDCVGQCYLNMGDLQKAKKYLYNSYFMRRIIYKGDIDCVAVSLKNIAKYHQKSGEFIKSIFFYKKYFQMMKNLNYDSIDYVYIFLYNIAQCLLFNKQYQQSIFILQFFLKIFSKNTAQISKTHIIIGLCYFNMGQLLKSLESVCQAISIDKNVIQQDIHKLSSLIKNIFKRYQFLRYLSLCLNLKNQYSDKFQNFKFKKYQYFLLMIYLLILEFLEQDDNQRFQLYISILEITKK